VKNGILVSILIAAVALIGYAYAKYNGDIGGRSGYYHDNGNVLLKIWAVMGEGDESGDGGWVYPRIGGNVYLYSSGLWIGTDCQGAVKVSVCYLNVSLEFFPVTELVMSDGGNWPEGVPIFADLDSYVRCDDSEAGEAGPIGIEVERHGYSFSAPPKDDFIGFQYKIYNLSGADLSNLYVSRHSDFDVGGALSYIDDLVGFDQDRQMPYMYDEDGDPPGYIGIICPQGTPLGSKGYLNTPDDDAGKFQYMQYSGWETQDTPYDYRVLYNTGPYHIPEGGCITVAFITVSGDDLADLQANADAAMDSYPGDTGTVNIVPSSVGRVKALYR
jgi:hypothetical protein